MRDDPAARLALAARTYRGPTGQAPRHLPFRRAAMSFMRWQAERGVLAPADGSRWWRAVNERLLRDGREAVARSGGLQGEPSSPAIEPWMAFVARPTPRSYYAAHNGSIVAAYVEHRDLEDGETLQERFFLNVVLLRVLYAHALVAAPALALGRIGRLGPLLGDPRLGVAGAFLSLRRVLPGRYPLDGWHSDIETYLTGEHRFGESLDYGVIAPRLQRLYDWSADALGQPDLRELIRDGSPIYAWPYEQRHVWTTERLPLLARALRSATAPHYDPMVGRPGTQRRVQAFHELGALASTERRARERAARQGPASTGDAGGREAPAGVRVGAPKADVDDSVGRISVMSG